MDTVSVYYYLPEGTRDINFGSNGYASLNNSLAKGRLSAVQPDGKILIAGNLVVYGPRGNAYFADLLVRFVGDTQAASNKSSDVLTKLAINNSNFDVQVFSNPFHDQFGIRVSTNNATDKINLKVVDLSGKVMEVISGVQSGEVKQLGANYPAGTYFIDVLQGAAHKTVKLIKL